MNLIKNSQEEREKQEVINRVIGLMGDLERFAYVELSPGDTLNMDDVVDILGLARKRIDDARGEGSGEKRLRELGLLAVKDKDATSTSSHFVLMSNGGKSLDGTGGSVTAPGQQTPVFQDHWSDVKFIAHTHPNEALFQTSAEFQMDCEVLEGAQRAEMVRRDRIGGGRGGTIFYTGDRVLSKKGDTCYIDEFAVTVDVLNQIVNDMQGIFGGRLAGEEQHQYNEFKEDFIQKISSAINKRNSIADALRGQRLSSDEFLQHEEDLAKLGECEELRDHGGIGVLFDASRLREQFADEYWKKFPKKEAADAEDMDIFGWLGDPSLPVRTEEEDEE